MSHHKNPYHAPFAESEATDRRGPRTISYLGLASVLFSCIPPLIVAGLLAAFASGMPPLPWPARVSALVGYGSTALVAVVLGLAALKDGMSISATLGILFGTSEILLLSVLLFFAALFR
jgi:uncharacterized membrane protein YqgA involved in biofilm formation